MVFCRGCGHSIHQTAPSCPSCGAVQNLGSSPSIGYESKTEQEQLSGTWQKRFALIEKAGGHKLPAIKHLSFGERWTVYVNWLAMLFGPFYYLAKGMWKRAITLTAMFIFILILLDAFISTLNITPIKTISLAWLWSWGANVHYYRKIRMNDNGWL